MDRPADASMRDVRTLLARAYADDPLMVWIFPDDATRPDAVAAWLSLFAEHDHDTGHVDTIGMSPGALAAVAIWRTPGVPDETTAGPDAASARPTSSLPTISGLLTAIVGHERAAGIGRDLATIRDVTPAGPHAYLHFLAVDPGRRREGLGSRVVEPGLRRADNARLGVHVETTNPDNLPFYRWLGFEVRSERRVGADGPTLWAMWRGPESPAPRGMDSP